MSKLARTRLNLVEEPHVLNRDHGLIGKRGYQLDLLAGKWFRHFSCHRNHPYRISVPQKWHTEHRATASNLLPLMPRVFRISQHVGNVHHSSLENRLGIGGSAARGMECCFAYSSNSREKPWRATKR